MPQPIPCNSLGFTVHIRQLEASDVAAVTEIEHLSFPADELWPEDWYERYSGPNCFNLVAEVDGNVVGSIFTCKSFGPNQKPLILTLQVHPDYRRRGTARTLLARTLEVVVAPEIYLVVIESNSNARALYESFGFELAWKNPDNPKRLILCRKADSHAQE